MSSHARFSTTPSVMITPSNKCQGITTNMTICLTKMLHTLKESPSKDLMSELMVKEKMMKQKMKSNKMMMMMMMPTKTNLITQISLKKKRSRFPSVTWLSLIDYMPSFLQLRMIAKSCLLGHLSWHKSMKLLVTKLLEDWIPKKHLIYVTTNISEMYKVKNVEKLWTNLMHHLTKDS